MKSIGCQCFRKVEMRTLSNFIARAIKEGREYQKILKRIDKKEFMKRELEITEAELFLLALRNLPTLSFGILLAVFP